MSCQATYILVDFERGRPCLYLSLSLRSQSHEVVPATADVRTCGDAQIGRQRLDDEGEDQADQDDPQQLQMPQIRQNVKSDSPLGGRSIISRHPRP